MKPKRIMIESAMYELKQDLKLYGKPLLLTAMVLVAMQLIFYEDTFRDSLSRMRVDSCLSGYFDIPLEKGMELESGRIFVGTVYSSFIVDAIYKTA